MWYQRDLDSTFISPALNTLEQQNIAYFSSSKLLVNYRSEAFASKFGMFIYIIWMMTETIPHR